MGVLARITSSTQKKGGESNSLATGTHAIDKDKVLAATDPTVINPLQTGTWETIRTAPVNHTPRYFNKAEADALKATATRSQQEARQTKRAYKSLKKIENADAQVHAAHRGYIRGVADSELVKKRSDAATARHLHALRPEYARMGAGLDRAENNANARIAEIKAKVKSNY
ncbi:MAG: hypothetical protein KME23_17735 [Goleter apudmare HA4340-LM2]|jgi:hypothetical protein|nr:hypothetical protein [Goleter apudmare HA4340-LM2]MBW4644803.1 hypothetical protein [Goleter apudmare HA4340-LM2]